MKKIYNYNNLKCSIEIAKIRLSILDKDWYDRVSLINMDKNKEKEELKTYIHKCNKLIKYIKKNTESLNNIELDLFKMITCENMSIAKSIEEIATKYYLDTQTIWKNHYRKIKPIINNLVVKEEL